MSGSIGDVFPSKLGGGIPGGQPRGGLIGLMEGGGDRGMFRMILRNSLSNGFNTDNRRKPVDSSLYTRFSKLGILTKTYNDSRF
jgi:hypothetical protein